MAELLLAALAKETDALNALEAARVREREAAEERERQRSRVSVTANASRLSFAVWVVWRHSYVCMYARSLLPADGAALHSQLTWRQTAEGGSASTASRLNCWSSATQGSCQPQRIPVALGFGRFAAMMLSCTFLAGV